MDKTLGQIAHEAGERYGGWARKWEHLGPGQRNEWESIAQTVAAAVHEEDARICEARSEQIMESNRMVSAYVMGFENAAAIRASIKEVK